MKKRVVSMLLALCMALMLLPGTAMADGGVTFLTDEDGTEHSLPLPWFQNGMPTSGDGWSWDMDTQVLTLSGYTGKKIDCNDVKKIILADGSTNTAQICGITCAYGNESLIIEGTGELIVTASFGLAAYDGPIILKDPLQMTGGTKQGDSGILTYDENVRTYQHLKTSTGEEATYVRIGPSSSSSTPSESTATPTQPIEKEQPVSPASKLTAAPTASKVLVNGEEVSFDAYNINDNNYFKLRDLAYVLNGTEKQFEITWDEASNSISLISGEAYTAVGGEMTSKGSNMQIAEPTTSKIMLDGEEISLTAYHIGGNNYFKLRDIGSAFDFGTDWDGTTETILIDTSKSYTAD